MWFSAFGHTAVAACRRRTRVVFFGAFFVQAAATTTRAGGRLAAVSPNVAELLATAALGYTILVCVRLNLNGNVTEASEFEALLSPLISG
jgi:hypothetical protein